MSTSFFAKIVSLILHPFIMVIFLPFFLVYKNTQNFSLALYWSLYTLLFLIGQLLFVFIAVKKKIFTDFDVSKREQRPLLFLTLTLTGTLYLISLFFLNAPFLLIVAAFGILFGVVTAGLINRWIKASMHVAVLTALTCATAIGYGGYFSLLLLLIPLLAWSRIRIKRHTMQEAIAGGVVGSLLSFAVYSTYIAIKIFLHK